MNEKNKLCRTCQKLITEKTFIDLNEKGNPTETNRINQMLKIFLPEIVSSNNAIS